MAILNKKLTEFGAGEKKVNGFGRSEPRFAYATEITVCLITSWHSQLEPEALPDFSCREIA